MAAPSAPLPLPLLLLALLLALGAAKPLPSSPYLTYGQCFRVKSPSALLQHPLVVLGDTRPPATDDALGALLTGFARDFALRMCRNAALQPSDGDLLAAPGAGAAATQLPLELFDCDILEGRDLALGVSRDYERNKEPAHALYFKDPVEATLEAYYDVLKTPSHPKYAKLSSMSLHDAIMEAAGLSDSERHRSALSFNAMTWRLCGFDCSPDNMTLTAALERATRNLNTRVSAVLIENSALWLELLQATIKDTRAISAAKRTPKLAAALTTAEQSVLDHSNFADRILYSIASGREALQRRCMRGIDNLPTIPRIRI